MDWMDWYNGLAKPSWTPSTSIILVTFGFVFVQAFRGKVPCSLALAFAVNLVANLLFMPIFAGLRNVSLAAVDVVIMWATIIWCIVAVWRHYRWIAVAQIPYLMWASIDMVMYLLIVAMNS
jgi:benzodiazapine receptor